MTKIPLYKIKDHSFEFNCKSLTIQQILFGCADTYKCSPYISRTRQVFSLQRHKNEQTCRLKLTDPLCYKKYLFPLQHSIQRRHDKLTGLMISGWTFVTNFSFVIMSTLETNARIIPKNMFYESMTCLLFPINLYCLLVESFVNCQYVLYI